MKVTNEYTAVIVGNMRCEGNQSRADYLEAMQAEIARLQTLLDQRQAVLTDNDIDGIWNRLPGISIHNIAAKTGVSTDYALRIAFARAVLASQSVERQAVPDETTVFVELTCRKCGHIQDGEVDPRTAEACDKCGSTWFNSKDKSCQFTCQPQHGVFCNYVDELRERLAARPTSEAAPGADEYVEVGHQYLVRSGFGREFWHNKDFYNGSSSTKSRVIYAKRETPPRDQGGSHD